MIDFSSVAFHLQVAIAEKIHFFYQKEFELSSKRGKDIINATKHKAVADVVEIRVDKLFRPVMYVKDITLWKKPWKSCSELCKISVLPRFRVSNMYFNAHDRLDSLIELCERRIFVGNDVMLHWDQGSGNDNSILHLSVILELFNVTRLNVYGLCPIDEKLFTIPKFCQVENIGFFDAYVTDEKLIGELQAKTITLNRDSMNRAYLTANLLFKQWFTKKRSISWFQITKTMDICNIDKWHGSVDENTSFSGLHYSIVWPNTESKEKKLAFSRKFRSNPENQEYWQNVKNLNLDNQNTTIYLIDREDKKLVIVVCPDLIQANLTNRFYNATNDYYRAFLMAIECLEIDDVIGIEEKMAM